MSRYIGAIDQGTSSTRFLVFDREGNAVACAQREHTQIYPKPGWVEHDALEIWRNTQRVIRDALSAANLTAAQLAGIGITNQRETTVLWDRRTGMPLYNAIVWQDTRVESLVAAYARDGGQNRFRAQTGLPLASYFSALKLQWLLEEIPRARALAESGEALFGTLDSWLAWNLTGGPERGLHMTDVTNASRTQLMNLASLQWDHELLQAFRIPPQVLPRIVSSSDVYASIELECVAGVPIAGMLGDQQAALVGQACFHPGNAKNTYGTGCFLLMNTGTAPIASTAGLVTTVAYQFAHQPACYALEGSIAIAGALVQWLRDNLGLIASSAEVERLAEQAPDNGDVYFVPAFSGLYAPHWKENARGVIVGLTRFADRRHLARACLEATAYQTRDVLEAMQRDCGSTIDRLRVDGGMIENELLMQFQADILNVPVARPHNKETTALGAAYAAGLATGYWENVEDLAQHWRVDREWRATMKDADRARLYGRWQKAVTRAFDWTE